MFLKSLFFGVLLGVSSAALAAAPPAHPGRNGALTEREMAMAQAAWAYFVKATQPETGMANAVLGYPSTTMWDTASQIAAIVSAHELGIIDKRAFDQRMLTLLATLRDLDLFRGELPNKVYNTKTGAKVDYGNKPGEVGYSALDLGRMLVWLDIVKTRYPYLANTVDGIPLRWNFCNSVADGELSGAGVAADGKTQYFQEGRLGYEEYAAAGFALWGFAVPKALDARPFTSLTIEGIDVPYDARDPRVFKTQNYVLTESYLLSGIELNWDRPDARDANPGIHTQGWAAEFAQRIYLAQQQRYADTGILTARSEHQVEGDPYFVYDSVFANGYAWNTLDPQGNYQPDRAAVAAKAAIGMWVLWDTPYTDKLFEAVGDLYTPDAGFYEGVYENGKGVIPLQTANNNGIILEALLYKVEGPLLPLVKSDEPQRWFTGLEPSQRQARCLPSHPLTAEIGCDSCGDPVVPPPVLKAAEYLFCKPIAIPGAPAGLTEFAARTCRVDRIPTVVQIGGDAPQYCPTPASR